MYNFLKQVYFHLPFKKAIFTIIKLFYTPSKKTALYLKFKGIISTKIGNRKYYFSNENTAIETLLFWKGINSHEPKSIEVWKRFAKKSKTIMDIGANSGIYSVVASEYAEQTPKIYGFDPIPRILNLYTKNMELNNINSTPVQKALSNENGEAIFFDMDSHDNQIGSLIKSHVEKHEHHKTIKEIKVEITTIDTFIQENNIDHVDLLKIDVEGVEDKVLEGMKEMLIKCKPVLLVEISNNETALNVSKFFKNLDLEYCFIEINENSGLIEHDNIQKNKAFNYLICTSNKKSIIEDLLN